MSKHRWLCAAIATALVAGLAGDAAAGESKEPKFAFKGHEAMIRSLSFSPDGKLLVSKGNDTAIWLWDVVEGKANRVLGKTPANIVGGIVAFAPKNKVFVVSEKSELWDVEPGKPKIVLQKSKISTFYLDFDENKIPIELNDRLAGRGTPMMFSPDAKYMAYPVWGPEGKFVTSLSPKKKSRRTYFHAWELASGEVVTEGESHLKWLRGAFSGVTDADLLKVTNGGLIRAVSADRKVLAMLTGEPGKKKPGTGAYVSVWEVSSMKLLAAFHIDKKNPIHAVAINGDGTLVAAGGEDRIVRVWEVPSRKHKKGEEEKKSRQ